MRVAIRATEENMTEVRSGYYRTNFSGEAAYKSFVPTPLPVSVAIDEDISTLLIAANRALAGLDVAAAMIPNMDLFISMYVRKEALMSSQIEGTQTTLEDVLNPNIDANTNRDVGDVVNYVKATEYAIDRMGTLPLCNRLLKETHSVLLSGIRGENKAPGEFRHTQNWIGGMGSTLKNASYIPPNVLDMQQAMSDLEAYINAPAEQDELIRAALIHYQFETIHPFLDGNGRVGRLLILLYLLSRGVIRYPALYISYYLKLNRIDYYDRMTNVRQKGNYEQWVKFFLQAVVDSACDALNAIKRLNTLHMETLSVLDDMRGSRDAISSKQKIELLEAVPIFDVAGVASRFNVSFNTANRIVRDLLQAGIITQTSSAKRGRTFCYAAYLDILRHGTELY